MSVQESQQSLFEDVRLSLMLDDQTPSLGLQIDDQQRFPVHGGRMLDRRDRGKAGTFFDIQVSIACILPERLERIESPLKIGSQLIQLLEGERHFSQNVSCETGGFLRGLVGLGDERTADTFQMFPHYANPSTLLSSR